MLRRLAISLAATSALVLTATAPALATHNDPEPFDTFDKDDVKGGNLKDCDGLVTDALEAAGYEAEYFWKRSKDVNSTDDIIEHDWWTVTIADDLLSLSVDGHDVPEGDFLVVLVKGGNATNMFVGPDLDDLFAPVNASGDHAQISNYTICKFKGEKAEEDGEDPDDEKTPDPDDEKTPEPKTSKSPAPVPTAVPAGASGSGDTSMAPVGIAAAALMVMAGSAALLRRRFAHQS